MGTIFEYVMLKRIWKPINYENNATYAHMCTTTTASSYLCLLWPNDIKTTTMSTVNIIPDLSFKLFKQHTYSHTYSYTPLKILSLLADNDI